MELKRISPSVHVRAMADVVVNILDVPAIVGLQPAHAPSAAIARALGHAFLPDRLTPAEVQLRAQGMDSRTHELSTGLRRIDTREMARLARVHVQPADDPRDQVRRAQAGYVSRAIAERERLLLSDAESTRAAVAAHPPPAVHVVVPPLAITGIAPKLKQRYLSKERMLRRVAETNELVAVGLELLPLSVRAHVGMTRPLAEGSVPPRKVYVEGAPDAICADAVIMVIRRAPGASRAHVSDAERLKMGLLARLHERPRALILQVHGEGDGVLLEVFQPECDVDASLEAMLQALSA